MVLIFFSVTMTVIIKHQPAEDIPLHRGTGDCRGGALHPIPHKSFKIKTSSVDPSLSLDWVYDCVSFSLTQTCLFKLFVSSLQKSVYRVRNVDVCTWTMAFVEQKIKENFSKKAQYGTDLSCIVFVFCKWRLNILVLSVFITWLLTLF